MKLTSLISIFALTTGFAYAQQETPVATTEPQPQQVTVAQDSLNQSSEKNDIPQVESVANADTSKMAEAKPDSLAATEAAPIAAAEDSSAPEDASAAAAVSAGIFLSAAVVELAADPQPVTSRARDNAEQRSFLLIILPPSALRAGFLLYLS